MPNNGVVLVVTSAGSHQLELEKSIKEKSSKKNVKIYFTFSPFCREACEDSLPVYKRLSDNRMFNLSDFSSKSFLETVVYTVCKYSFRIREGCGKSKWKFKMAFAMKGGGSRGGLVCH